MSEQIYGNLCSITALLRGIPYRRTAMNRKPLVRAYDWLIDLNLILDNLYISLRIKNQTSTYSKLFMSWEMLPMVFEAIRLYHSYCRVHLMPGIYVLGSSLVYCQIGKICHLLFYFSVLYRIFLFLDWFFFSLFSQFEIRASGIIFFSVFLFECILFDHCFLRFEFLFFHQFVSKFCIRNFWCFSFRLCQRLW